MSDSCVQYCCRLGDVQAGDEVGFVLLDEDLVLILVARVEANADGATMTVERLRAQTLRDELRQSTTLLGA